MDRLADLFYVACMATEAAYERAVYRDRSKERLAEFFLYRRVTQRPLKAWSDYGEWVARLCADLRPWRIDLAEKWDGMDDPIWE
jgi:hypothetical protein